MTQVCCLSLCQVSSWATGLNQLWHAAENGFYELAQALAQGLVLVQELVQELARGLELAQA